MIERGDGHCICTLMTQFLVHMFSRRHAHETLTIFACPSPAKRRRNALHAVHHANMLRGSDQVLVLLQIESPLVLQPPPVILHACDLLAVVVRDRILGARR